MITCCEIIAAIILTVPTCLVMKLSVWSQNCITETRDVVINFKEFRDGRKFQ